jgi:hypothetical protein
MTVEVSFATKQTRLALLKCHVTTLLTCKDSFATIKSDFPSREVLIHALQLLLPCFEVGQLVLSALQSSFANVQLFLPAAHSQLAVNNVSEGRLTPCKSGFSISELGTAAC